MGKNFAQRVNAAVDEALDIGFQSGYQKAADLKETLDQLDREYGKAWRIDDESDWAQKEIDGVLARVCGDKFVPFYTRNWAVKKITYGKSKGVKR